MRITVPEPVIGDYEGFNSDKDIFKRKPLGDGLTNLVSSIEEPVVIALDAEWGSGKTTFLKMWAGELRKNGFPVVYFDAFANDYVHDAFVSIAGEIIALAKEKEKAKDPTVKTFTTKALGVTKVLLKAGAGIGIKAATLGVIEASDAQGILKDLSNDIATEASKLADKELEKLLKSAEDRKTTLQAFREALSALPGALVETENGEKRRPLIFIIDELDRCTPPFALSLIERVKHIFTVQNVQFVLGIHQSQLCESVKAIYGREMDAQKYLQKFIHIRIPLIDTSESVSETANQKYIEYIISNLKFPNEQNRTLETIGEFLGEYDRHFPMSLRDLERLYTILAVAISVMNPNTLSIAPLIAGLAIMKLRHPDLYLKAKRGNLQYEEVSVVLGLNLPGSDPSGLRRIEWTREWWRYAIDPQAPDELVAEFGKSLVRYHFGNRFRIVPFFANEIIDRFISRRS